MPTLVAPPRAETSPSVLAAAERLDEHPDRRQEGRRHLRRALRLFAAFLLLAMVLRLPALFVDVFNSDETYLATQAQVINEGGRLYHDATDRKPPLVPYIYAATFDFFDTKALWSVRIVAMVAVALTALLLAWEARRRWGGRAALLAGLLFVLASVAFAPQDGQAANFEIFMLPAMTAAVLLAVRGRGFEAGGMVALATLAKQTGAATLLPVVYLLWRARGRQGARDAALGFALPIAVVAALVGPGDLLFWAVLGNGSYFGLGSVSLYVAGLFLVMTAAFVGCNLPLLWTLPSAWSRRGADGDLWLWLASGALSVAVGLRFFGHYYLQLLPPLCLLAAGSLATRPAVTVRRTVAAAAALATAFSILGFWVKPWADDPHYQSVSRFLEAQTRPRDRVFVWGHMPEIYWASGARPATRFLSNGFLIGDWGGRPRGNPADDGATPGAWPLFMSDMRAHPPKFILDTTPAGVRGSQYAPMNRFPELEDLIQTRYRYDQSIDGIAIYERRPLSASASGRGGLPPGPASG